MKPSKNDSGFASNRSVEDSISANRDDNKSEAVLSVSEEDVLKDLILMNRRLAHQLNNQLTTILANTQLVFLMLKSEELKPYLKAVEDATRAAAEMVGSFQESVRTLAQMFPQDS